jgi:hypothetical protein
MEAIRKNWALENHEDLPLLEKNKIDESYHALIHCLKPDKLFIKVSNVYGLRRAVQAHRFTPTIKRPYHARLCCSRRNRKCSQ